MQTLPRSVWESCFLFRDLSPEEKERVAAQLSPPFNYDKGERIYSPRSFRKALGLVISGTVLVQSVHENHTVIMNRLFSGSVFGAAALFSDEDDEDYVSELVALDRVCVHFIPQDQLLRMFEDIPQTAQNYIRFLSGRVRFLNRKVAALTNGTAISRVYHYFLCHQQEDGTVILPNNMTELARSLNMGRSSLYRSFDTLVHNGMVKKDGKRFRL